jgi:hypothetical protein
MVISRWLGTVRLMQQRTFTATPIPVMPRSAFRSRLILPASSIARVRAALEARVAEAPDDIAARVSLGELNLSVSLAESARASRRDESVQSLFGAIGSPAPDLLRARHVVPALASIALPK